jgi:hypothetical protein
MTTANLTVACVWQSPRICMCKREHFRTAPLCEVCEAQHARRSAGQRRHFARKWRGEYRAEQARIKLGVQAPQGAASAAQAATDVSSQRARHANSAAAPHGVAASFGEV